MILSLETATPVCSVALHDSQSCKAVRNLTMPQAHSSQLTVLIEEVLAEANLHPTQLQAVAVSKGPGSYTGLRIGTSVAKGLCFALNIPLLAVNTLEALTHTLLACPPNHGQAWAKDALFCPMLDARRMEVYCAVFEGAGKAVLPTEAKIIDENSFVDLLEARQVVFFGEGASKCQSTLKHPNAIFIADILTTAEAVGNLAYTRYVAQEFEDLAYFEPFYLKDFVNNTLLR